MHARKLRKFFKKKLNVCHSSRSVILRAIAISQPIAWPLRKKFPRDVEGPMTESRGRSVVVSQSGNRCVNEPIRMRDVVHIATEEPPRGERVPHLYSTRETVNMQSWPAHDLLSQGGTCNLLQHQNNSIATDRSVSKQTDSKAHGPSRYMLT